MLVAEDGQVEGGGGGVLLQGEREACCRSRLAAFGIEAAGACVDPGGEEGHEQVEMGRRCGAAEVGGHPPCTSQIGVVCARRTFHINNIGCKPRVCDTMHGRGQAEGRAEERRPTSAAAVVSAPSELSPADGEHRRALKCVCGA